MLFCKYIFALLFVITGDFFFSTAEEVVGCGGFVKLSPFITADEAKNIDLSTIKVTLYNKDNVLQYSIACVPTGFLFNLL